MKVATIGINERGYIGRTQEEMLAICEEKCRGLKSQSPDLIVLPEIVFIMYPHHEPLSYAEFYPMALERMKKCAAEVGSYIVFNMYEPVSDDKRFICNFVINKKGELVAKYRKMYPTEGEMAGGVIPGTEVCVVDTEFGRLGIATCFDIGFRSFWQSLADLGAQAVIWTSAYDGGKLLDAYAVLHSYYVISSVRTYRARVIDPAGRTVAESTRWDEACLADIDLATELFHIDDQIGKIREIRSHYGTKVAVETLSEDNVFTVSSKDAGVSVADVKRELDLLTYAEYHARAIKLREEKLNNM